MKLAISLEIILSEDGQVIIRPLGYTARNGNTGPITLEQLNELATKVIARSNAPPAKPLEQLAAPAPPPETPMQRPIVRSVAGTSIAAAEAGLQALGFNREAAEDAVRQHGAKRCDGVVKWARNRMKQGGVNNVIRLIEVALENNPGHSY